MSYLRKKLQAIMACADFKGYLREVTGYPLTLTDCMGSDLVSLSVTGNAVQDGTPSPDAPVEVQGCGEKTGNLFDYKYFFDNCTGINLSRLVYEVKPNTSYTVHTNIPTAGGWTSVFLSSGVVETVTADTDGVSMGNPRTVTADENGKITITLRTVSVSEAIELHEAEFASGQYWVMLLEGSYTTDTMPPFEPYGYKVPLKISGINRLSDIIYIKNTNGSAEIENSIIHIHSSTVGEVMWFWMNAEVEQGKTYTIHCTNTSLIALRYGFSVEAMTEYSSDVYADNTPIQNRHATFTATESGVLRIVFNLPVNTPDGTIEKLQVVEGTYTADTMPAYEPYHEPQTFNVYMDKPLYATGDVGDEITLDFEHKTATRTNKIRQLKDFGVSYCAGIPRQTEQCIHLSNNNVDEAGVDGSPVLSTHFVNVIWIPVATDAQDEGVAWYPSGYNRIFYIYLNKTRIDMTADDTTATLATKCNAYIQTLTGREAYYQLLTPATIDISAMQDWDTIPKLWRGTVTVSAGTAIQPSSMTAKYYATQKED